MSRIRILLIGVSGMLNEIVSGVKDAGFKFVTLDLEGYRTGSMNAMLSVEELAAGGTK